MRPMPSDARNVLLITTDQQHWNTLGCLNPEIRTPNLDRLAAGGTLFTRAYCPNPTCTPTRASIITGKYPSQHGAWSLGTRLPESEHTVGEDLQAAGVRTALVGKAHFQPLAGNAEHPSLEAYPTLQDLAFWRRFHGPFYGFEHVELARNHTDEAHVGQHYALVDGAARDWTTGVTTSARPPAPTTASGGPGRSRRRSTTAPGSPSAAASCWTAMPSAGTGSCSGRASSIRTPSTWSRSRGTGCTIRPR